MTDRRTWRGAAGAAVIAVLGTLAMAGLALAADPGPASPPAGTDPSWKALREQRQENALLWQLRKAGVTRDQVDDMLKALREAREAITSKQQEMQRLLEEQRAAILENDKDKVEELSESARKAGSELRSELRRLWSDVRDRLTNQQRAALEQRLRARVYIHPRGPQGGPRWKGGRAPYWSDRSRHAFNLPQLRIAPRFGVPPVMIPYPHWVAPRMPDAGVWGPIPLDRAGIGGIDRWIEALEALRDALPAPGGS